MEHSKHPPRLYNTSVIENKRDELEEKYERSWATVEALVGGLSETDAHDALNVAVARDKAMEEAVVLGLLTRLLTDPSNSPNTYRDLMLVCRDGLHMVQMSLTQLVVERWPRLTSVVKSQILYTTRELMRASLPGLDNLLWSLMRYMAGGDVSQPNIFLVDSVLDILIDFRSWVEKVPLMVATTVYTYLRLAEDHMAPQFSPLLNKEITFLISLIRERFNDCLIIGRDLVRLLQNIARISEIEALWRDMLYNPKLFSPNFNGIVSLMETRTSRKFLQSRLTPDMEQKIVFLTSNVRFGNHKRYQDWFQRQYLNTSESQSLRSDLIRFIVGVIHPTNELLSSDIIPRWAVIGWLLTTCPSTTATTNAKLALFYDWLFYDPERDNIMNIEPAILVIHNSLRSHPAVTATLLDFLCRIMNEFYPPCVDRVRQGVCTALKQILEKRVLQSLYPLFTNPNLDRELKSLIHDCFPEFSFSPPIEGGRVDEGDVVPWRDDVENHSGQDEAVFSDEEQEDSSSNHPPLLTTPDAPSNVKGRVNKKIQPNKKKTDIDVVVKKEIKEEPNDLIYVKELKGPIKAAVGSLHLETDNELKCEAMEKLLQVIIQEEDEGNDDIEMLEPLAKCLCQILAPTFENKVFPESVSPESLEDSTASPLFVMMRNLVELTSISNDSRHILSVILVHMASIQPKIGYLLLYFLLVPSSDNRDTNSKNSRNDKMTTYKEFCQNSDKNLKESIMADMKLCQEDDVHLLCWLAPGVYNEFPNIAIGDPNLFHIVVSSVDARQLQELVCLVVQGRLVMLDEDSLQNVLTCSLMWETFEQMSLWHLVSAHAMPIDSILPLLTKLDFASHAEALTHILLMLQQEKPRSELVKAVLSRDVGPHCDMFVESVLLSWCKEDEELLADLVGTLLSSRCPAGGTAAASPGKRKRATTRATAAPTADRILGHLERLRPGTKLLYKTESMQKALQLAQSACTDSQKLQFSSLFALLDCDETSGKGSKSNSRSRRHHQSSGTNNKRGSASNSKEYNISEPIRIIGDSSSEEWSQEEETLKKGARTKSKCTKKRRKVVNSDSD